MYVCMYVYTTVTESSHTVEEEEEDEEISCYY